uniref:Uncharacterized protein n=1 Tax=Aegilops tauschii subsp. strangulata TaxID=200361 RepID=A0A453AB64_AEGTS
HSLHRTVRSIVEGITSIPSSRARSWRPPPPPSAPSSSAS